MKITLLTTSVLLAVSGALSSPVRAPVPEHIIEKRADAPSVKQVLQFALTLEHLENAFYKEALGKFGQDAFLKAGMSSWGRGRFAQIGMHESSHVQFLQKALGGDAPAPCQYNFPLTDVGSFIQLAKTFENIGTSAYLGAAQFLASSPTALTAAGAILTTEARHSAWVASAVQKGEPWSGSFDVPLDGSEVFSLASAFIKSCPSSNPQLPFTAFPKLTVNGTPQPGKSISLSFDKSKANGQPLFLALMTGLNTIFTPISGSKTATIPSGLQGIVYAVVSTDGKNVADSSTIAGPVVLSFPFDSSASNA